MDAPPMYCCCPITGSLMTDPVMDTEGNTYERAAIEEWLLKSQTSPVTRTSLTSDKLTPNRNIRELCEAYRAKHGGGGATDGVADANGAVEQVTAAPIALPIRVVTSYKQKPGDQASVLHVSIRPLDDGAARTPVNLTLVIDVSGSMGSVAKIQTADGTYESDGLSLLDIVKHAARTVIATLGDSDRLAIVAYSSQATCLMPLTWMNPEGKTLAKHHVETMVPLQTTNLWDGLHTGLQCLAKDDVPGRPQHVMLLTDGAPNIKPPRGHLPMLKLYREKQPEGRLPTIHTFGFGYSLDSALLHGLAKEGGGVYAFVPDAGFVGTAFVNAIAHILSTCATHAVLNVELDGQTVADDTSDMISCYPTSWGVQVPMGVLTHGQSRDVVLSLQGEARHAPAVQLNYLSLDAATLDALTRVEATSEEADANDVDADANDVDAGAEQQYRQKLVAMLRGVLAAQTSEERQSLVASFGRTLSRARQLSKKANAYLAGLNEDVQVQITQSVSRDDWYARWGVHYLRSLSRAHELQCCSNFRDPGLQRYGGSLFCEVRDVADDLFNKLPPPTPSTRSASAAPVNISRYNVASGPCFAGQGQVLRADGTTVCVDAVQRGDVVWTPHGPGQVRCVLETRAAQGFALTTLPHSGLEVTPYHPVRVTVADGDNAASWTFPCTVDGATTTHAPHCTAVYSFLVERKGAGGRWAEAMCIDGVTVVTLAHGLTDNAVVRHPYYGTEAVVSDLCAAWGWTDGRVVLDASRAPVVLRDPQTTLVCSLRMPRRGATASSTTLSSCI